MDITKSEIVRFELLTEQILNEQGGEKLAPDAFLLGNSKRLNGSLSILFLLSFTEMRLVA